MKYKFTTNLYLNDMFKTQFITLICMLIFVSSQGQHLIFDSLLKTNVDENGMVDYQSFKKNEALLDDYLVALQKTKPSENWSLNKQKAYWLNTYNAYTIKIILANYPIQSIKEIKKKGNVVWKIPFIKIGEKKYTLDWIEHEVLRKKFNDPRIHVGINCASMSCPKLGNFAFSEDNIETALDNLMLEFINNGNRNKISEHKLELSKIFDWFSIDFTKNGTLIEYINKYVSIKVSEKASIKYLTYDWSLNIK